MNRDISNLIWILLICLLGCSSTSIELSGNRRFPKEPQFTLPKGREAFLADSSINFDALYVYTHAIPERPQPRVYYNYFRFWPSSQVLMKSSRAFPKADAGNDFGDAFLGYYAVDGKTVEIELFMPNPGTYRWDYMRKSGNVGGDYILITNSAMGNLNFPAAIMRYDEHPLDGLNRAPDW
jgi:hypothetical protein